MPAKEIKAYIGEELWNDYFKFTVVRNPFDKMISAYFHFEKANNSESKNNEMNDDIAGFRKWVANGGKVIDRDVYMIDGEVTVDFFIRYENLREDIEFVCQKLNLEYDLNDLPRLKSEHRDRSIAISEFYDEETEKLVRDLYKFEIEYFNYNLEK